MIKNSLLTLLLSSLMVSLTSFADEAVVIGSCQGHQIVQTAEQNPDAPVSYALIVDSISYPLDRTSEKQARFKTVVNQEPVNISWTYTFCFGFEMCNKVKLNGDVCTFIYGDKLH